MEKIKNVQKCVQNMIHQNQTVEMEWLIYERIVGFAQ
jgi:hypothetical protein